LLFAFLGIAAQSGVASDSFHFRDKKNILSTPILSPLLGHVQLGYTRYLQPRRQFSVRLGLMNVFGVKEDFHGQYLKVGPKLMMGSEKAAHQKRGLPQPLMQGLYLHPELLFAWAQFRDYSWPHGWNGSVAYTAHAVAVAATVSIGYQAIFWNHLSLDTGIGLGVGFTTDNASDREAGPFYYGFVAAPLSLSFTDRIAFAFTSHISVGFVF
jgi:hypothetical protein